MNVDDLSWQSLTLGGVSPRLVRALLDLGRLELLVQAAREGGDWHCAEAAARALCAAGEFERALALTGPFADIGWRPAQWVTAEVMIQQGRAEEALAAVRPDGSGLGDGHVCARYAELAVMADRVDEAVDVLAPHLGEPWLLRHLVEVTEGRDGDDRVLDLLARAEERAGRLPEALALLRSSSHSRAASELTYMLVRHGRPAEALAAVPSIAEQRAAMERQPRTDDPWAGAAGISAEPPPL
ncbi:hypothetical protein [Streptomyces sp. C]|uniref:hypothetical protein n=1 Tax=Streptomyces sp. C TaxID=253839 RepID=UPI0001B588AD|nr:hypothetical protein [Streptomyces sp. C]EFL19498.1 predicted protein [Streptomyces sp. C]